MRDLARVCRLQRNTITGKILEKIMKVIAKSETIYMVELRQQERDFLLDILEDVSDVEEYESFRQELQVALSSPSEQG